MSLWLTKNYCLVTMDGIKAARKNGSVAFMLILKLRTWQWFSFSLFLCMQCAICLVFIFYTTQRHHEFCFYLRFHIFIVVIFKTFSFIFIFCSKILSNTLGDCVAPVCFNRHASHDIVVCATKYFISSVYDAFIENGN